MLDLLISTVGMIIIFFFPFFLIKYMKIFKLLMVFINFCLILALISNIQSFKDLDVWKFPEEFHPIQKTIFLPIKSIKGIYDSNSNLINLDFGKTDGIFSIVKTNEYSKECLHNYFIKQTSDCPMTDIILEKTQVNTHDNYIEQKISDEMYLYYTKESNLEGKLYENISIFTVGSDSTCNSNNNFKINNKCSNVLFKSNFDYKNVSEIIELEEEKKSNPFKSFKNFVYYIDRICLIFIIFSFIFTIYEPFGHKTCNYFKIISWICHIINLIILSIRYNRYRKIKEYFNKHKDIYEDNLPNEAFNLDTAVLSISISIFVYYIIYLIIPSKCHCTQCDYDEDQKYFDFLDERKGRIFALFIPLYIIFVCLMIYEIVNDNKIKENYKFINYNWELKPVTSISISYKYDFSYYFKKELKGFYIEYNTNNYSYYDIYTNNDDNSKICGKDSQENDLYFPNDVECPVNDIFISKFDSNEYDDYTKIKLSDEVGYLYYTNKKTTGKIVTAIVVGTAAPLEIYSGNKYSYIDKDDLYKEIYENNYGTEENNKKKNNKLNNFNTVFFYEEIYSWYECKNEDSCSEKDMYKLYAVNYLGVNENLIGKIGDFKKNLDEFKNLCPFKYISYGLNMLFFIYFSFILLYAKPSLCHLGLGILFLLFKFSYIIINTISLNINLNYVQHFLNIINIDFERYKCDSFWIFLLNILGIIFFFYFLSIIVYRFIPENESNTSSDRNRIDPSPIPSNNDTFVINFDPGSKEPLRKPKPHMKEKIEKEKEEKLRKEREEKERKEREEKERKEREEKERKEREEKERKEKEEKERKEKEEKERKEKEENERKIEPEIIIIEKIIEKKEEKPNCVICLTNEATIILYPCGHRCVCKTCFTSINSNNPKKCPLCREVFNGKLEHVFNP